MKLKEHTKSKVDLVNNVSNKLAMDKKVSKKETKEALDAINHLIKHSKGKEKMNLKYERDYIAFKSSSLFNNYLSAGII